MKSLKHKQSGFSLFMVMIIMLVIALLVVVTSQLSSTEMRISTNEADRKFATSLAENGLREAENLIGQFPEQIKKNGSVFTFKSDCSNGLCAAAEDVAQPAADSGYKIDKGSDTNSTTVAWKRTFNGKSVFDAANKHKKAINPTYDKNVTYIIEYLGERQVNSRTARYFRVTSRAKGQNENTVVTLQSHVEMIN